MTHDELYLLTKQIADALRRHDLDLNAECVPLNPGGWQCHINLSGQGRIAISDHNNKGQTLHISGSWPCDKTGQVFTPHDQLSRDVEAGKVTSINVSVSKGPDRIAHDIARRLLPDYFVLLRALQERIVKADAYNASTIRTAKKVAEVLGVELDEPRPGEPVVIYPRGTHMPYALRINGESVSIERSNSMPLEMSLELLRCWKRIASPDPTPSPTESDKDKAILALKALVRELAAFELVSSPEGHGGTHPSEVEGWFGPFASGHINSQTLGIYIQRPNLRKLLHVAAEALAHL